MRRSALPCLIVLAVAAVAVADVVHLRSGGKIEGLARRDGDHVNVESLSGETKLRAADVELIDSSHTAPMETYVAMRERLRKDPSIAGHLDVAVWAEGNRGRRLIAPHVDAAAALAAEMTDPVALLAAIERHEGRLDGALRPIYERILRLDPGCERARRGLGHRLLGGRWVTGEEWQAAQGNVLYEGTWMTQARRRLLLLERELDLKERGLDLDDRARAAARRERDVSRREERVAEAEERQGRVSARLAEDGRDLARRKAELEERERALGLLKHCRVCGGYYREFHICPKDFGYCARCDGCFRAGHRCR